MKPYYEHAGITIYHGDCREILPSLNFDLIISDPQYGISHPTDYASRGRSKLARCNNYIPFFGDNEPFDPSFIIKLSKPTILWGANHYSSRLPDASGWLVWNKERPDGLDQATAELAWTSFVKGVRVFNHLWNGMMRASEHGVNLHPTQKPVALYSWIFSLPWCPEGIAVDSHMGSGPMLRAAKDVGRKAIGIEVNEKYCQIAAERLEQEVLFADTSASIPAIEQPALFSP